VASSEAKMTEGVILLPLLGEGGIERSKDDGRGNTPSLIRGRWHRAKQR